MPKPKTSGRPSASAPAPAPAAEAITAAASSSTGVPASASDTTTDAAAAAASAAAPAADEETQQQQGGGWFNFSISIPFLAPAPEEPPEEPLAEEPTAPAAGSSDAGQRNSARGVAFLSKSQHGRLMQLESNKQHANTVRQEKLDNKQFVAEQRERFRQRGQMLRQQRAVTEAAISGVVDRHFQQAASIGDAARHRQAALRSRRHEQDVEYERQGRALTEKYSTRDNQELVRRLKAEIELEREEKATEMRNLLKKLKKETDDTIKEVNHERVRRVYAETAHPVIRIQKQTVAQKRCAMGRQTKKEVAAWKREKQRNEQRYVEWAREIVEEGYDQEEAIVESVKRMYADRIEACRAKSGQTIAELNARARAEKARVKWENRVRHDEIDYAKLVLEEVVGDDLRSGRGTGSPRGDGAAAEAAAVAAARKANLDLPAGAAALRRHERATSPRHKGGGSPRAKGGSSSPPRDGAGGGELVVTADKDKEADPLSYFSHYFGFRRTRREPETKQEMGSTTGEKESARSTMMSPKESARSSARRSVVSV